MNTDPGDVQFPRQKDLLVLYPRRVGGDQHNPPYWELAAQVVTTEEEAERYVADKVFDGESNRVAMVLLVETGKVHFTNSSEGEIRKWLDDHDRRPD